MIKDVHIRLLKLWELLRKNTDEQHPISTNDLLDLLKQEGIDLERKTLYKDIKTLNQYGYEVICIKSKSNLYYTEDRDFELAELKILIDAVQSANFITEKKTALLIDKLSANAGKNKAATLKRTVISYETTKHTNESIFYNVDSLTNGILNSKKVSFLYFDYNQNKKRVLRKNGERYVLTPIHLIFSNDNYYLIAYSEKHDSFVNFRVDRMKDVIIANEPAAKNDKIADFDLGKYKKSMFSLFSGEPAEVELIIHNSLINVILDKFGEETELRFLDKDHIKVKLNVVISPTFFAWCFNFSDRLKVIAPAKIVNQVNEYLIKIQTLYKNV